MSTTSIELSSLAPSKLAYEHVSNYPLKPKALYSKFDLRENIYALDTLNLDNGFRASLKTQVCSVACMVDIAMLETDASTPGGYRFRASLKPIGQQQRHLEIPVGSKTQYVSIPFGEKEAFLDEINPAFGTAFLVGSRYILTAAHCVCKNNENGLNNNIINQTRIVFGFYKEKADQQEHRFRKEDVYQIQKVVSHCFSRINSKWSDWALLKLDRKVEGRTPLVLNHGEKAGNSLELYMLGHPSGLPLKFVRNAEIKKDHSPHYFEADIDAFAGNSGSPIFERRTCKVLGILAAGNEDYETDLNYEGKGQMRVRAHHVTDSEISAKGYERCQRISAVSFISHFIRAKEGNANAQFELGKHYEEGIDIPKDTKKALKWFEKASYQGHSDAQNKFNHLSIEKLTNIDPNATVYQKAIKGLNFESTCENQSCLAYKKVIIIQKGLNTFNIPKEMESASCPSCAQTATKIQKLVFWDCRFTIDGLQTKPNKAHVSIANQVLASKYMTYEFFSLHRQWSYLEVNTKMEL